MVVAAREDWPPPPPIRDMQVAEELVACSSMLRDRRLVVEKTPMPAKAALVTELVEAEEATGMRRYTMNMASQVKALPVSCTSSGGSNRKYGY